MVETTNFLILGGEMRVKEFFPGKKNANHRAVGSAVVKQVRTLETQIQKIIYRKRGKQELEVESYTGKLRRQISP